MADYYIQKLIMANRQPDYFAWYVDDQIAYKVGIHSAKSAPGCFFEAKDGKIPIDIMRAQPNWADPASNCEFVKSDLGAGRYYPRMARTSFEYPHDFPGICPDITTDNETLAVSTGQLDALTLQLEEICRTVHPDASTLQTFGHNIRNLLILACTEVEAQWSGVLGANEYHHTKMTTSDYVKLAEPLRLREYEIRYRSFPWLNTFKPFANWNASGRPTQDLEWYAAYNRTKHNREIDFREATLARTLEALTACYVMLLSQYGAEFYRRFHGQRASVFEAVAWPSWQLNEVYIRPDPYGSDGHFSAEETWHPKNYVFP
jgi:hypothetical protein